MPASVPSRLPASYLRDRILQTPRKKNDVKQGGKKKKTLRRTGDPSCPRPCSRNEKPSFKSDDDWGFIFLSGFLGAILATCLVMCLQFQFVGEQGGPL